MLHIMDPLVVQNQIPYGMAISPSRPSKGSHDKVPPLGEGMRAGHLRSVHLPGLEVVPNGV